MNSLKKKNGLDQQLFRESLDRGPGTAWRRELHDGIVAEGTLRGGIPHGPYREWFPSGQLRLERNLCAGGFDGLFRQYAPDGRLLAEFSMDRGDGIFVEHWDAGPLKFRWLCFHLEESPWAVDEFFDLTGKRFMRSYTLKGAPCLTKKRFLRELEKYGLTLPQDDQRDNPSVWTEFARHARVAVRQRKP